MAQRAAAKIPAIRRIILFGSMAKGTPTPRSDADILIEVDRSAHDHPRDRNPEMIRAMSPLVCPVDLFVYTTGELAEQPSPVVVTALRDGIDLLH